MPIWLTRLDIAALERHHGIRLLAEGAPDDQTITGHIDFLQIRNGAVHILDYKPDARTNRPFASSPSMPLRSPGSPGFACSTSSAPDSTRTNTANFSRARCSPIRTEIDEGGEAKACARFRRSGRAVPRGPSAWSLPAIFVRPHTQDQAGIAFPRSIRLSVKSYVGHDLVFLTGPDTGRFFGESPTAKDE